MEQTEEARGPQIIIPNSEKYLQYDFVKDYDNTIDILVPKYRDLLEAAVEVLPFEPAKPLRICEFGSGSGNLTLKLLGRFPKAEIRCYDVSPHLIAMAESKLSDLAGRVQLFEQDVATLTLDTEFDLVISSLFFHEIEEDCREPLIKASLDHLTSDGLFVSADYVANDTEWLRERFFSLWLDHMIKDGLSQGKAELEIAMHRIETYTVDKYVSIMRKLGFGSVDLVWNYLCYVVFAGVR